MRVLSLQLTFHLVIVESSRSTAELPPILHPQPANHGRNQCVRRQEPERGVRESHRLSSHARLRKAVALVAPPYPPRCQRTRTGCVSRGWRGVGGHCCWGQARRQRRHSHSSLTGRPGPSCPQQNVLAFTLPNGLKALVISDPNTDMAAAAVGCSVGSLDDEADLPGQAHFTGSWRDRRGRYDELAVPATHLDAQSTFSSWARRRSPTRTSTRCF